MAGQMWDLAAVIYFCLILIEFNKNFQHTVLSNFLPISFNIWFGCSKGLGAHWDGSFEYPQHMFWMRNKKSIILVSTLN